MLKKIILGVLLNAAALYAVSLLLSDLQYTGGLKFFVISGLVIGILNTFIKPLMKILSFPVIFMTVGLFSFVINVIIFWLTIKAINGIHYSDVTVTISSIWTYFIAALVFAMTNWILHMLIRNK